MRKKKILRNIMVILAILVIGLGIAGYFLLGFSPVPETSTYELDLAKVRQLAQEGGRALPVRLNKLTIAEGGMPKAFMLAGSSLQEQPIIIPAFQVVYPDNTVIIDTVYSQSEHEASFAGKPFYAENFDTLQKAMLASRYILVTHEHFDHIAGISRSPYLDQIIDKTILTREQIDNAQPVTGFTPELLARFKPLSYEQYYQLAPGLVLIKAPAHTPGSQIVYVRLQNGSEYLLLGDVVWLWQNIEQLRGRALLASLMLREDRKVHLSHIRTLYNISRTEPIHMVVSHDGKQVEQFIQQGLIGEGFE